MFLNELHRLMFGYLYPVDLLPAVQGLVLRAW